MSRPTAERSLYEIFTLIEETVDPRDGRPWKVEPGITGRQRGAVVHITTPDGETFRSQIPSVRVTEQTLKTLTQQLARYGFDIAAARSAQIDRAKRAQAELAAAQAKRERDRNLALAAGRPEPEAAPRKPKKKYPTLEVSLADVDAFYAMAMLEETGDGSNQKRLLTPDNVQRFVKIIEAGLWIPDVMCVDWYGYVINGRHRLQAIFETEATVPCIILWGCDPRMFTVFDTPKVRTAGDTLYAKGLAGAEGINANHMGSALRMVHSCKQIRGLELTEIPPNWSRRRVENTEILMLVDLYPGIYKAMESAKVLHATGRKLGVARFSPSPAITFCYLAHERWPECEDALDQFMVGATLGLNMGASDPRKALYNLMLNAMASKTTKIPPIMQLALLIKQWNWWLTGRKNKQGAQWRASDGLPVPITGEEVTLDLDAVLAKAALAAAEDE